jgi:acyl-CoA hydrolase
LANYISGEEAVKIIKSGDNVFLHGGAATPHFLLEKMVERANELNHVELISLSSNGPALYADAKYKDNFHLNSLFVSANVREAVNEGRGDYIPVFMSEIPNLFLRNILPLDVALVHVSLPDKHGFCSLGVSVDVASTAIKTAKHVIAQVNPNMPRTFGDGTVNINDFDAIVHTDHQLPEVVSNESHSELASLFGHKELGLHTEMFSDGILPLMKKGIITNQHKKRCPGKIVTGFILGSRKLYDFVDDNPDVLVMNIDYVNDSAVVRTNPKVTAINSAIEVDITGQVCADSIGTYHFSGVGGQVDFMRGAALSEGGKPIIALASTTSRGESKIVSFLKAGAGVVTTRAHAHYIITEYGVAFLYGKNMRERAKALINIAHPDHREMLEREAFERFKNF